MIAGVYVIWLCGEARLGSMVCRNVLLGGAAVKVQLHSTMQSFAALRAVLWWGLEVSNKHACCDCCVERSVTWMCHLYSQMGWWDDVSRLTTCAACDDVSACTYSTQPHLPQARLHDSSSTCRSSAGQLVTIEREVCGGP
jgi:hypothetical protein